MLDHKRCKLKNALSAAAKGIVQEPRAAYFPLVRLAQ